MNRCKQQNFGMILESLGELSGDLDLYFPPLSYYYPVRVEGSAASSGWSSISSSAELSIVPVGRNIYAEG